MFSMFSKILKSDSPITENTTETSPPGGGHSSSGGGGYSSGSSGTPFTMLPELYPSIPQPPSSYGTPSLPYNIMPTPVLPSPKSPPTSPTRSKDTLPYSLDDYNIKFKFQLDTSIEDSEMNKIGNLVNKNNIKELLNEIDSLDFSLEKNVLSTDE